MAGSFVLFAASVGSGAPGAVSEMVLVADRDDDDLNGKPDGDEDALAPAARVDLVNLDPRLVGAELRVISGAEHARVLVGGRPLAWGKPVPPGAALQGISPGIVALVAVSGAKQESLTLDVIGVGMRDGARKDVDLARDHASLERTPPERLEGPGDAPYADPDALRVVVTLPDLGAQVTTPVLAVESVGANGARMDLQARMPVDLVPCGSGKHCYATAPLRFVVDDVDRVHAVTSARSLRAEVGGAIVLRVDGRKMQAIRVLGPRSGPGGPIGRMRATLRPFVMRVAPGDGPAIGGNEAGAVAALRAEFGLASAMWGQCGLTFGPIGALEVKVADPPPSHLISFGQDLGFYASGGELRVRASGQLLTLTIAPRSSPERVARQFAQVAERNGLTAIVSPNARISPGASGSVDVSLRRRDGSLVTIEPVGGAPISTDPTLTVRIGRIDFSNGLQHFGDMDSMSGTLEERTLVKALDDGDPRTIEIIVIPSFSGGGRIGESFIASDLSSVRNVVLLDRAGVRARRSSLTLAHELGHVFLNIPGHPDDYGIDTPTLLMDSDASDASPFGPRRLTLDECARALRESGPHARLPLLTDWPLTPMRYEALLKP